MSSPIVLCADPASDRSELRGHCSLCCHLCQNWPEHRIDFGQLCMKPIDAASDRVASLPTRGAYRDRRLSVGIVQCAISCTRWLLTAFANGVTM